MLDEKFCTLLEYAISKALKNVDTEELRGFWCDGVILQADEYSAKFINDKREITGTVFTGKTGQEEYELIVNFGTKSISRFVRGLTINECIPDNEKSDWLWIDIPNKKLSIQLE